MQGIKVSLQHERPSHRPYLWSQPNSLLHHPFVQTRQWCTFKAGAELLLRVCVLARRKLLGSILKKWVKMSAHNVKGFPSTETLQTAWFTELLSKLCLSASTHIHPLQMNVVFSFLTNVLATVYPASSWFTASSSWSVFAINSASVSFFYHNSMTNSPLSCSGQMNA